MESRLVGMEVCFLGGGFAAVVCGEGYFLGGRSCLCVHSRCLLLFPLQEPRMHLRCAIGADPKTFWRSVLGERFF